MYFRVVLIEYISVMFQISFAVSFNKIILSCSRFWLLLQAIDHIINSAAKSNYMSAGQISVPIVFRGPNGAAAGVGAQHSHVWLKRFLIHLSFCKHTYSLSQAAHFILSLSLSLSFESQMFWVDPTQRAALPLLGRQYAKHFSLAL